jgi:hypothetical protein
MRGKLGALAQQLIVAIIPIDSVSFALPIVRLLHVGKHADPSHRDPSERSPIDKRLLEI